MKVRIENQRGERNEEQRGLAKVFKTPGKIVYYQVSLYLDLSEEERAVLTQYKLWDVPIYSGSLHLGSDQLAAHPELSQVQGPIKFSVRDLAREGGFHQDFRHTVGSYQSRQQIKRKRSASFKGIHLPVAAVRHWLNPRF
ncbi:MAG: hypothetical protein WB760_18650 [Xanthobacteraceae bacterium]